MNNLLLDEAEWKRRYIARLVHFGLTQKEAEDNCNAGMCDLQYPPEEAADNEIDCMMDDMEDE